MKKTTKDTANSLTITLNRYKCVSWNKFYAGMHWTKRQVLVDDAQWSIWEAVGKQKPLEKPVDIAVYSFSKRPVDSDNICSKVLIDGLKAVGLLVDDTPKYVRSVKTVSAKDKIDWTMIVITS